MCEKCKESQAEKMVRLMNETFCMMECMEETAFRQALETPDFELFDVISNKNIPTVMKILLEKEDLESQMKLFMCVSHLYYSIQKADDYFETDYLERGLLRDYTTTLQEIIKTTVEEKQINEEEVEVDATDTHPVMILVGGDNVPESIYTNLLDNEFVSMDDFLVAATILNNSKFKLPEYPKQILKKLLKDEKYSASCEIILMNGVIADTYDFIMNESE